MMKKEVHPPLLTFALIWASLGAGGCVSKPAFHCQSDAACVSDDGSKGKCEASGECTFHSQPSAQGGTGGLGDPAGDSGDGIAGGGSGDTSGAAGKSSGGASNNGGGPSDIGAAGEGEAGASCTDGANDCYTCRPTTSQQFLNACTSSGCVPFDDRARVTRLSASGTLPQLPAPTGP